MCSHNVWGGIESWLHEMVSAHREAGWSTTLAISRGKRFNDPERFREHFGDPSAIEIDGRTGTHEGRIAAVQAVVRRVRPSIVVVPMALGHVLPAVGRSKGGGIATRLVAVLQATNANLLVDAQAFAGIIDLVVAVNPIQTAFLRGCFEPDRLAVIPNGANPAQIPRLRRRPDQPIRLLLVARLHQGSKRIFDAVAMAAELRRREVPFRYTIAGDGPDAAELRKRVADQGLSRDFEMPGYVHPLRLQAEFFPNADILTLFSPAGEGLPLVTVEGMTNGCVPVMSEWTGVWCAGNVRVPETALVFPVGDTVRAADHVEELWRNAPELERMSNAGVEAARELTWTRIRQRWIETMDHLRSREPVALGGGVPFPLDHRTRSGRLDLFPWGLGEGIRRLFRRYPDFEDGWGEWPGTISGVSPKREGEIMAELMRIDRQARDRRDELRSAGQ
jgi:glycosyltransferase involved in cell wall biosynthesis